MDWMSQVSHKPLSQAQQDFSINPESKISSTVDLGAMIHVGYLPVNVQHHPSKAYSVESDSHVESVFEQNRVEFNKNAFARSLTSHIAANKGVSKYGDNVPIDLNLFYPAQVLSDVLDFFPAPKSNSVPVLTSKEVCVATLTSPGWWWKRYYVSMIKDKIIPDPKVKIDKRFVIHHNQAYMKLHWKVAHLVRHPELWSSAVKEELLKMPKLVTYDHRCFIIGSTEFFLSKSRLNQAFNQKLSTEWYTDLPIKVGIDLTKGGFTNFIERMGLTEKWKLFFEGDCVKWDSRMSILLFWIALYTRFHCWDKQGMSQQEWLARNSYYLWQTVCSFIVTPAGQVLLKHVGNPSGDGSTTYENCLGHLAILCFFVRAVTGRSFATMWDVLIKGGIYADDHLFSVHNSLDYSKFTFRERERWYRAGGVLLDPAKDFVSDKPEGHTFLGLKAVFSSRFGRYVPVYNRDKALCSALYPGKKMPLQVRFDRYVAIMGFLTFDEEYFDHMNSVCVQYAALNRAWLERPRVPTHYEWICFWLGLEGSNAACLFMRSYRDNYSPPDHIWELASHVGAFEKIDTTNGFEKESATVNRRQNHQGRIQ